MSGALFSANLHLMQLCSTYVLVVEVFSCTRRFQVRRKAQCRFEPDLSKKTERIDRVWVRPGSSELGWVGPKVGIGGRGMSLIYTFVDVAFLHTS